MLDVTPHWPSVKPVTSHDLKATHPFDRLHIHLAPFTTTSRSTRLCGTHGTEDLATATRLAKTSSTTAAHRPSNIRPPLSKLSTDSVVDEPAATKDRIRPWRASGSVDYDGDRRGLHVVLGQGEPRRVRRQTDHCAGEQVSIQDDRCGERGAQGHSGGVQGCRLCERRGRAV
jgi:hypothetical protein